MVSILPRCKYVEENIIKALPMIMCSKKHEEELVCSTGLHHSSNLTIKTYTQSLTLNLVLTCSHQSPKLKSEFFIFASCLDVTKD